MLRAQHLTDQVLAQQPPSSKAISQIPALIWELIFGRPSVGRSTPVKWQFHRFLLWQLIFHSYSESSSFGRPGPDRSTSHPMVILQILALTAHYSENLSFGRPGLGRSIPLIKWQFHRFLLWQLTFHDSSHFIPNLRARTFGRPSVGRSTPLSSGNFTDSYSDNSYFIPTLRAYHLEHQVLADLPPHQTAISQIPALLWELIFSRPLVKWWISQIAVKLIWQLTSLRAQHLADQVLADLTPLIKWQFHRFLWNPYFIPTLRAQHLADQVLADLPSCQMAILQIAPAHISFLLWELII